MEKNEYGMAKKCKSLNKGYRNNRREHCFVVVEEAFLNPKVLRIDPLKDWFAIKNNFLSVCLKCYYDTLRY